MNIIVVLLYVSLATLAGYFWVRIINSHSLIFKFSLGFLLGNGLVTYIWFVLYRLGLPFNLASLALSFLITLLAGFFVSRFFRSTESLPEAKASPLSRIEKLMIIAIAILAIASLSIAFYRPISAWDALTLYDLRAKHIHLQGDISELLSVSYYISYPLMTSLMHAAIYLMGGSNVQVLYSLFYINTIVALFSIISTREKRSLGFLAALLFALNANYFHHSLFPYTNLPFTTYIGLSFLLLIYTNHNNAKTNLIVSGILLSLSTWTRSSEPYWIVWLIVAIYTAYKQGYLRHLILPYVIFEIVRSTWLDWQKTVSVEKVIKNSEQLSTLMDWEVLVKLAMNGQEYINYFLKYTVYPYIYMPTIILAASVLVLSRKHLAYKIKSIMLTIVLSYIITIIGILIISLRYDFWIGIGDSVRRMIMFVDIFSIFLFILLLHSIDNIKKTN